MTTVYVILKTELYEEGGTPIEVHKDKRIANKRAEQYNKDEEHWTISYEVTEVPFIGELT